MWQYPYILGSLAYNKIIVAVVKLSTIYGENYQTLLQQQHIYSIHQYL